MPFGPFGEYVSTSVEVPLTNECKRILTFAVEEAANSKHEYVGVEHLLLGILREQRCLAARLLQARGVEIDAIRQKIMPHLPKEERSHDAATEQPIAIRKVIVAVLDAWRTLYRIDVPLQAAPPVVRAWQWNRARRSEFLRAFLDDLPVGSPDRARIAHGNAERLLGF